MIRQLILVGIGGGAGSILRYLVSYYTAKSYTGIFPRSTFIINLLGCLLIGILIGLSETKIGLSPNLKLLLVTGFCGGYTTFSTFSAENFNMIQSGHYITAILYIMLSIILGIIAVWGGISLVKL